MGACKRSLHHCDGPSDLTISVTLALALLPHSIRASDRAAVPDPARCQLTSTSVRGLGAVLRPCRKCLCRIVLKGAHDVARMAHAWILRVEVLRVVRALVASRAFRILQL